MTMLSYITVNLLITIGTIYYNKIVGEDRENVLTKVFDKKYVPVVKDGNYEIGDKKSQLNLQDNGEKDDFDTAKKMGETIYIIVRGVYASLIFYFVPYMYLFVAYGYSLAAV